MNVCGAFDCGWAAVVTRNLVWRARAEACWTIGLCFAGRDLDTLEASGTRDTGGWGVGIVMGGATTNGGGGAEAGITMSHSELSAAMTTLAVWPPDCGLVEASAYGPGGSSREYPPELHVIV
jgi:hypothetical protein